MKIDKVRFCMALPTALYSRLEKDSSDYGISKAGIVTMLLVDYYKGNAVGLPIKEPAKENA